MTRSWIQFRKGYSLTQFMGEYGTEERCVVALFRWRWPNGFVCPEFEHTKNPRLQSRALHQGRACRLQVSLTAGTNLDSTMLPLRTWFLAMYLIDAAEVRRFAAGAVSATGGGQHVTCRATQPYRRFRETRAQLRPDRICIPSTQAAADSSSPSGPVSLVRLPSPTALDIVAKGPQGVAWCSTVQHFRRLAAGFHAFEAPNYSQPLTRGTPCPRVVVGNEPCLASMDRTASTCRVPRAISRRPVAASVPIGEARAKRRQGDIDEGSGRRVHPRTQALILVRRAR